MSVSKKVTARVTDEGGLCHRVFQRRVLGDDGGLKAAEFRAGVDAELIGQQCPRPLIGAQGLTLSAGAVEGEHQLAPSPLAQRCVGDRSLEFPDDFRGPSGGEEGVGAVFDQRGLPLDPACLLGDSPAGIGQFGRSAPQSQRLVEADDRLRGVAGGRGVTAQLGGQLVTRGIDLGRAENPAGAFGQHEAVAQRPTQCGDVGLQGLGGGARWLVAPEEIDQCLGRHDSTAVQPEHAEDRTRLGARYCDRGAVPPGLERSQNPQLHGLNGSHVSHRRRGDSTPGQDPVKARPAVVRHDAIGKIRHL